LVPYTIGVLFSLVLREIYRRKLWEKENMTEEESDTSQENVVVKLYDSSLDEEIVDETSNNEMSPEAVQDKMLSVAESNADESNTVESNTVQSVESDVAEDATVSDSEPNAESDTTLLTSPESPKVIPEIVPTEMSETSEMISEPEIQSPLDEFQPELSTKPKEIETNLSSVFDNQLDNQKVLANTFRIDDVLDEMTNENPPIIPADLSLRLEEDSSPENRIKQIENEQDWQEPDENEILAQIANPADADSNNLSLLQSDVPFNQEENPNNVHSDISPMAVELLGEDFNFNSFFENKLKHKKVREEPISIHQEPISIHEEPISISEISPGIYQADGGCINIANKQVMRDLLPKEQEVVSLYSGNLIQNAVIEPDSSEIAQKFSFTEESLPMFVRKKNRK
jgi:hypothetical protein